MLTSKHAVVTDFGICRAVEIAGGESLTSSGIVIGTPSYMSPEQGDPDAEIDGRSDIYALGCVLYEMLIGEPPFTGPTAQVVISRHMSETVPSLRVARHGISADVEAIVMKALAKTPADRYATGAEFRSDLQLIEAEGARGATLPFGVGAPRKPARRPGPKRRLLATEPRLRIRRWLIGWRRVAAVVLLLFALGTAIAIWRLGLLEPSPGYALPEPSDYIAIALGLGAATAEEDSLGQRVATSLAHVLGNLRDLTVVRPEAIPPLLARLDLDGQRLVSAEHGLQVAAAAQASNLVTVSVRILRDTATATAARYDVARGEFSEQYVAAADADDFVALARQLTTQLFDLNAQQLAWMDETRSLGAAIQVQDGERYLNRWELGLAERAFREALAVDSTFARAHHLLALTLYYQGARDPQRLLTIGADIRRHAGAARRHGTALAFNDSLHVAAFYAFAEGDLGRARSGYSLLTEAGPTDHHAWLMRGIIEHEDIYLVEGLEGTLELRGSWDEAIRSFGRAVQLRSDFYLGYASLLDVYSQISAFIRVGYCKGFKPPDMPPAPIWVEGDGPEGLVFMCPVDLSPIRWAELDRGEERPDLVDGAEEIFRRAEAYLRSWLAVAPEEDPQTHQIQVNWLLDKRRTSFYHARPDLADSLARQALAHAVIADSLRTDTLPEATLILGALHLATSNVADAVRTTDRGLREWSAIRGPDEHAPDMAANVPMAVGRSNPALRTTEASGDQFGAWVNDPDTEEFLVLARGPEVMVLRAYGSLGVVDEGTYAALDRIQVAWGGLEYDARQQTFLRGHLIDLVGTALVPNDSLLEEWVHSLDEPPDIWAGLAAVRTDRDAASEAFDRWWADQHVEDLLPEDAYLGTLLAQHVGQDSIALQLLDRIQAVVLRIQRQDIGWGLRSRSHLLSARSHVALGDSAAAGEDYAKVVALWEYADPEFGEWVEEAMRFVGGM